jgi:hypothetical protein
MTPSLFSRGTAVGLLALGAVLIISLTELGALVQKWLLVGYGLAIPVIFALVILSGVYFSVRHLLTA